MKKATIILAILVVLVVLMIGLLIYVKNQVDQKSTRLETIDQEKSQCLETLRSSRQRGLIDQETYSTLVESMKNKESRILIVGQEQHKKFSIELAVGSVILSTALVLMSVGIKNM